MSVDEIIARERKGAFGFTDDRRCLFTYGDFRRLLMEIEAAWKRERDELISQPRTWEECVDRAMKVKENSDERKHRINRGGDA